MNDRQMKIVEILRAHSTNGWMSARDIAWYLKYRPARSGQLAVSSSLHSLHRSGMVFRIGPRDQWDHAVWGLTKTAAAIGVEQP